MKENHIYSQRESSLTFQKTLTRVLEDFKVSPKEARELVRRYDRQKKDIYHFTSQELGILQSQFGEEITGDNFLEFMENEASKYLDTTKPDKELLYDGITDFLDFQETGSSKIDLQHPQKPENISFPQWASVEKLLELAQKSGIQEGSISFTKENGVVLELDTSGSNVYIRLDGDTVIVTGQNDGQLFVEKISQEEFGDFVRNYDTVEFKRVLEMVGFTGGLTFAGILSFSFRTGIGWALGYLGTGFGAYRGYKMLKSYHVSKNDALLVLQENKNNPELVKSYVYASQVGYVVEYKNGVFHTIDGESLTAQELIEKETQIDPEKYQLLRGLQIKGLKPKYISSGKYELDMNGLFDTSPLIFQDGKISFSTTYFEKSKILEFENAQDALSKILKINEYLASESQLRNHHNNSEIYNFNNPTQNLEKKLQKLKTEILEK